jgi:hypothetical protein
MFTDDVLTSLSNALEHCDGEDVLWATAGAIWCLCMDPDILLKIIDFTTPQGIVELINAGAKSVNASACGDTAGGDNDVAAAADDGESGGDENVEDKAQGFSKRVLLHYSGCNNAFVATSEGRKALSSTQGLQALVHAAPRSLEGAEALCNVMLSEDREAGDGALYSELARCPGALATVTRLAAGPPERAGNGKNGKKQKAPSAAEQEADALAANSELRLCGAALLAQWAKENTGAVLHLLKGDTFKGAASCLQFACDCMRNSAAAQVRVCHWNCCIY